jgi:hypothetical protein
MEKKLELASVIQELESRYEVKKEKQTKDGKLILKFIIGRPKLLQKTITKSEVYISIQNKYNEDQLFADIYIKTYHTDTRPKTLCLFIYKMETIEEFNKLINLLDNFDIIFKFLQYQDFDSVLAPTISIRESYIEMRISVERKIKKLQSSVFIEINDDSVSVKNQATNVIMSIKMNDLFSRDKLVKWSMGIENFPK